jgi:hypothetical protein
MYLKTCKSVTFLQNVLFSSMRLMGRIVQNRLSAFSLFFSLAVFGVSQPDLLKAVVHLRTTLYCGLISTAATAPNSRAPS